MIRRPLPGSRPVRFGVAELLADLDRANGWLLSVDGIAQSYVDLDDPTHLEFDYVRRIGDVIDCVAAPGTPLDALHIGGGACTLPRYIAATRPGSRQLAIDADGELIDLVRTQLDLDGVPGLAVRVGDGRAGVREQPDAGTDLIVLDAFERAVVPGGLATVEFTRDVARVLRPWGTYLVNVSDGRGLHFARRVLATLSAVFPHVLLLAEPGVLRGRRFGNLVFAASAVELPVEAVRGRAAGAVFPARCVTSAALSDLRGNVEPLTDAAPMAAPTPPADPFASGRS
ncbi:spermidine synthase [Actinokineospora sp.]|uniref:spermidine synthase n=1 Tax=Actinokineospora sp. TaxID=1872133 RepID=UPI004037BEA6